ncbi:MULTISPECIES: Asp-tRNA(Asn)/Glu-tRNA(Gln) amidotransferase subunit GatC [unclassified Moraxella]|uniref:Asp-tRNA(Asn)/Glu-tRNA(Gln) amidotransferase subunit GatC n=1 Tax=unclassified Moraxella TaxID=2685852 RepID=UPI003AF72EFE
MSQSISTDDIMNVASLSRLAVNAEQADSYAKDLSKILAMMDILADVNTDGVAPLTNVHDMTQRLREDVVDGNGITVNRELNQSIAPSVADGLFLVPQVIE